MNDSKNVASGRSSPEDGSDPKNSLNMTMESNIGALTNRPLINQFTNHPKPDEGKIIAESLSTTQIPHILKTNNKITGLFPLLFRKSSKVAPMNEIKVIQNDVLDDFSLAIPSRDLLRKKFDPPVSSEKNEEKNSSLQVKKIQIKSNRVKKNVPFDPQAYEKKFKVEELVRKRDKNELKKAQNEDAAGVECFSLATLSSNSSSSASSISDEIPRTNTQTQNINNSPNQYPSSSKIQKLNRESPSSAQEIKEDALQQHPEHLLAPPKGLEFRTSSQTTIDNQSPHLNMERNPHLGLASPEPELEDDIVEGFYEDIEFGYQTDEERAQSQNKPKVPQVAKWSLRKDPQYKNVKCIIFPDDYFLRLWHAFITASLMSMSWTYLLRMSYVDDSATFYRIYDWIIYFLYVVDIFINFNLAYYDQNTSLIYSHKQIAKNYLFSRWFLIDTCALLPLDWIFLPNELLFSSQNPLKLLKLIRMIKVGRTIQFFRERKTIAKFINYLFRTGPQLERLIASLVLVILLIHVSACLWKVTLELTLYLPDNWLKVHNFYDLNGNSLVSQTEVYQTYLIYIASSYLVVQTIVTVGFGDLYPTTVAERIICCIWMFLGVFVYSITIGTLASLVSSLNKAKAKYNKKLNILLRLKKDHGFSTALYFKIKRALGFGLKHDQDNIEFLKELPENIQKELSCIIHKEIIDSIPFFKGKPKNFLAAICSHLRIIKIAKGETIFMEGDRADEMFFLKSGQVAYVIPQHHNFKFLKIKEGYYFGEMDLLFHGEVRRYTIQATKNCELYVLNRREFKKILLVDYRNIGLELAETSYKRRARTRKAYEEALAYFSRGGAMAKIDSGALQQRITVFEDQVLNVVHDESWEEQAKAEGIYLSANIRDMPLELPDAFDLSGHSKYRDIQSNLKFFEEKASFRLENLTQSNDGYSQGGLSLQKKDLLSEKIKANTTTSIADNKTITTEIKEINQKVDSITNKVNKLIELAESWVGGTGSPKVSASPIPIEISKSWLPDSSSRLSSPRKLSLFRRRSVSYYSNHERFVDLLGSTEEKKNNSLTSSLKTRSDPKLKITREHSQTSQQQFGSDNEADNEEPMLREILLRKSVNSSTAK